MPTTRITADLDDVIRQRAATPGRPEDGPYPATVDEVADEIATYIAEAESVAPGLVLAVFHRLGDHQLAKRAAPDMEGPDPDTSFWVSDDAGPSGYEWGCVECHGDDPGGREFYRSAATAAAWVHGREAHPAPAVTR